MVAEPAQLWPQLDIRDPLGVWGARALVTGDASGGSIKVTCQAPAERSAAFVYTAYAVTLVQLTGTLLTIPLKMRILTNWPDISATAGVQGFATFRSANSNGDADFTAPKNGNSAALMFPNDRFILIFDPRQGAGVLNMIELEMGVNVNTDTYAFEAYGYYWDRSVLNAPGGPRHPGSA